MKNSILFVFLAMFAFSIQAQTRYTAIIESSTIDCTLLQNTHSQQFKKPSKENPVEMIYLKDLETVELLQWVTDSANFVQLKPFATINYNASMLTPMGWEYKSLSPIDGKRFISMCSGRVYLQDRTAALPHSTATCPSDVLLNVDMIKELPPITYPLVGATKTNYIHYANLICNYVPSIPINNDCFSYE